MGGSTGRPSRIGHPAPPPPPPPPPARLSPAHLYGAGAELPSAAGSGPPPPFQGQPGVPAARGQAPAGLPRSAALHALPRRSRPPGAQAATWPQTTRAACEDSGPTNRNGRGVRPPGSHGRGREGRGEAGKGKTERGPRRAGGERPGAKRTGRCRRKALRPGYLQFGGEGSCRMVTVQSSYPGLGLGDYYFFKRQSF